MKLLAIGTLLATTAAFAFDLASPVLSGTARVVSERATVTDEIRVRVDLVVAAGPYEFNEPEWASGIPDEFELESVVRVVPSPQVVDEQRLQFLAPNVSYVLTLAAIAPGEYTLGPFELRANAVDPDSEPLLAMVEPISVTVESILTDGDTALADIKDPFDPPPDYLRYAMFIGGAVLAAALLAAGVAVLARRRPEAVVEPPAPAHVSALAELDALLASDLIASRRWKAYFGELSGVLRRYIEKRFDLHAPTQTTEEFLRDHRTRNMFEPQHDALVRGFLGQADMIKFAEGAMDAGGAREAADRVRTFVEETGVHITHEGQDVTGVTP